MATRIDGVAPDEKVAVVTLLQGLLGSHQDDLDVHVERTATGWNVRITAALPDDGPALLPGFMRENAYADLAEALTAVLSTGVPRSRSNR